MRIYILMFFALGIGVGFVICDESYTKSKKLNIYELKESCSNKEKADSLNSVIDTLEKKVDILNKYLTYKHIEWMDANQLYQQLK